jgi:zinc protease
MARLPLVTVLAMFDRGAGADPVGQEGLAQITARALTEGTATRDGAALTLAAEVHGSSFDASADWDGAYVGFTAQREHVAAMLSLFAEVLRTPAFPARDVERLRAERLADIEQTESDPGALADERFLHFIYREGARFGVSAGGTRASVATIDAEACRRFHATNWQPSAATFIVTGDITTDDAILLLNDALGDWHGTAPARTIADDRGTEAAAAVHIIAKAGAPQSELRVGHVAVPRSHPDFFALTLMNAILGGLFNSRVNLNLREKNGYTYGASSGFDWRRLAGPFVVSSAVQTDVTRAALEEIMKELHRMRTEPVTPDELTLAQRYLAGVFPIRYETTGALGSALAAQVQYELPADYFATYRDRIRAVTAAEIQAAAARHLDPARLQVVLVGDPAVVHAPLEAWGFAPVTVHAVGGA